jgi:hypothetical protein
VSLDIAINHSNDWSSPPISEFPIFTDLITRHRSLKKLVLRNGLWTRPQFGTPGLSQLHIQPNTRLPSLEELTIPEFYKADQLHVSKLIYAMDWSSLRHLDLLSDPGFLIRGLIGLVPQLKSLSLSFSGKEYPLGPRSVDKNTMAAFIRSIDALEEVSFRNNCSDLAPAIWEIILDTHDRSLRKLAVDWKDVDQFGLKCDRLQILVEKLPSLEVLSLTPAYFHHFHQKHRRTYDWVSIHINSLNTTPYSLTLR